MLQFAEHVKDVVGVVPDITNPRLIHSAGKDRCVFSYDLKKEKRVVGHQVRRRSPAFPMPGLACVPHSARLRSSPR